MAKRNNLILATANAHKVREMQALLADCGWDVEAAPTGMADIEETGSTFAENAKIKALAVTAATGCIALADDSGLMVDALNGEPGVHSKRWAGDQASDGARIAKLLNALGSVPADDRSARFVCAACIAGPQGVLWEGAGRVEGVIAGAPSGDGGFGYDPIFHIREAGCTMACLSEQHKNAISHRGRAISRAADWLRSHLER